MASYERRGNSIRVVVRVPGGGKKTAMFDMMREAKAWGQAMKRKKALGEIKTAAADILVAEMLESYLDDMASKTDGAHWNTLRIHAFLRGPHRHAAAEKSHHPGHQRMDWPTLGDAERTDRRDRVGGDGEPRVEPDERGIHLRHQSPQMNTREPLPRCEPATRRAGPRQGATHGRTNRGDLRCHGL